MSSSSILLLDDLLLLLFDGLSLVISTTLNLMSQSSKSSFMYDAQQSNISQSMGSNGGTSKFNFLVV